MFKISAAITIAFAFICTISVSAQCGYDVNGTSGFILSPNYPSSYGNNLDCYYTITTPEDGVVFLEIVDMHTESSYDYVTIYDGPTTYDRQLARYSGTYYNILINATTNVVLVHFTTDGSNSYQGFNITFQSNSTEGCGGEVNGSSGSIQSPNYPNAYDPNSNCYYSLNTPENTALTLQIEYLDLESYVDYITIYDGPTYDYRPLGNYTGHSWSNDSIYASTNQALVYFHSDSSIQYTGFAINFTEREYCGEEVSGTFGAIISEGYPSDPYPSNQNCFYKITTFENTAVTLEIVDMDLETTYDYIEIYDGPTTSSPFLGRFSGQESNVYIYASTNEALVYFHTDSDKEYKGFFIYFEEREISQICPASAYTTDSGVITSPLYPNTYPNNTDCYYSITTSENTQITFQTLFLDVESSSNCSHDYVEFFNGPTAEYTSLAKFCGSGPVFDIISSTNEVFVNFHSDSLNENGGFNITYNTNPCPDPKYFYGDFGTIYSPGFPLYDYPKSANCIYSIEAPLESVVYLTVIYMSIESTSGCSTDYVRIYDGPSTNYPLLVELCGGHTMSEYQASSNEVLIEFHSDSSSSTYRGFAINYVTTYRYGDAVMESTTQTMSVSLAKI